MHAWREKVRAVSGRPLAIEALWDGDTEGWFLDIYVVCASADAEGGYSETHLGCLRYGGDFRLFEGTVPPWPEAAVAKLAGERVARELSLEFYFPSPDSPDDDCPHWWEREQAIPCRTCGKPLVPNRGPYVPADQCSPCHSQEQGRKRLMADAPVENRYIWCAAVEEENVVPLLMFNLDRSRSELLERLAAALLRQDPPVQLSEHMDATLPAEVAADIAAWNDREIDSRLDSYSPRADLPEWAASPRVITWRGVQQTIQTRFNQVGEDIDGLVRYREVFRKCARARGLRIVGNGGMSDRDDSFLRYISRSGAVNVADLRAAFPFLAGDAVEGTLAKMEQFGCLARQGQDIQLLPKGKVLAGV